MIAHETDAAAAQRLRLAVEDMDARPLFHQHDLMKIMVVFREYALRCSRLNRHRQVAVRKKVSAV